MAGLDEVAREVARRIFERSSNDSDDDDSSNDDLIYEESNHTRKRRGLSPIEIDDDDFDYDRERRWRYHERRFRSYEDGADPAIENDTSFRLSKLSENDREMVLAELAKARADKDRYTRKDTSPPQAVNLCARSYYRNQKRLREESGWKYRDADTLKESSVLTYEDVKGITIRRSKLAKFFTEPFFEELIVGCFVRVRIGMSKNGPTYCLCIVRNVDAGSDPDRHYKLENKTADKYLNVVWGNENSVARWQMDMVSDARPTKGEFEQLIREVKLRGGKMPSKQEVLDKRDAVEKCSSYVYYAESVKQMFHEKKSRPLDVEAEKDQRKHDEVEVEKTTKAKVHESEASRQTQQKDNKAISLAEMNRKNRVGNLKNASEAQLMLNEKAEFLAQKMEPGVETKRVERCKQRNLDMEFLRTDISSYPEEVRQIIQQQKAKIINNLSTGYYDL